MYFLIYLPLLHKRNFPPSQPHNVWFMALHWHYYFFDSTLNDVVHKYDNELAVVHVFLLFTYKSHIQSTWQPKIVRNYVKNGDLFSKKSSKQGKILICKILCNKGRYIRKYNLIKHYLRSTLKSTFLKLSMCVEIFSRC